MSALVDTLAINTPKDEMKSIAHVVHGTCLGIDPTLLTVSGDADGFSSSEKLPDSISLLRINQSSLQFGMYVT